MSQRADEEGRPDRLVDPDRGIEVRMMGDYVAVCWRISVEHVVETRDDVDWHARVATKIDKPYIDFITLREYDGVWCISEKSPVEGGMSVPMAR